MKQRNSRSLLGCANFGNSINHENKEFSIYYYSLVWKSLTWNKSEKQVTKSCTGWQWIWAMRCSCTWIFRVFIGVLMTQVQAQATLMLGTTSKQKTGQQSELGEVFQQTIISQQTILIILILSKMNSALLLTS